MTHEDLDKLGSFVYISSLKPLTTPRVAGKSIVVGFDSEFDSKTRELLSVQFSHNGVSDWYIIPKGFRLTWEKLEFFTLDFLSETCGLAITHRHMRAIKLITYFSIAETQHIEDITTATIFETSVGTDFVYHGRGGRTIEIVDLQKFFNNPAQPLYKVAQSFGYEKLDYDTSAITRKNLSDPKFKPYALNDAILVEEIFNDLRADYLDNFNVDIILTKTPAQTSATIFRLHYLKDVLDKPDERIRRLSLLSAWGGRNEAYRRGNFKGDFYEYDAFSEYPNSAIEIGTLPRPRDWFLTERIEQVKENEGIIHVEFEFPEDCLYPCLPQFADNKLFYVRKGASYCTNAEVRLALELGARIEILEGYHYKKGTDALALFMRDLLKQRQEAKDSNNTIRSTAIKLAINSLIGKFIQRVQTIDLNALVDLSEKSGLTIPEIKRMDKEAREFLADEYKVDKDKLHNVSLGSAFCPEWNGLILGYARAATSRFLVEVARNGWRPCIASTDSVVFEVPKDAKKPEDEYPITGILFRRQAEGDKMQILRTRLYRIQSKGETVKLAHHAVAGRKIAEKLFDKFWKKPNTEFFTYSLNRIIKLRAALGSGKIYGEQQPITFNVRLGFDNKRQLIGGGDTRAWETTAQET